MKERLTVNSASGLKLLKGKKYVELLADKELTKKALNRLAELEDEIEQGALIEKYFICKDKMPNGKAWYNVCMFDSSSYVIKEQCKTQEEAEKRLKDITQ